ncbi:MAG: 5-demethoxyubiquinol-8 5-hydroxylase UbiM [Sedimenticola sp.]|uniref:5-demethoxyubiquinol-8 5-hydroxylase UbiM n=1 Tax=Sedimenticola thiotaurini TaxID=1543721 RepID=A0A558D502_9GAMM|nr:5-demethoxyubiquinol-8 5-hydroxylase UbiM [Sedimenticola sp.]MCW8949905.1 5-demethoxyubiquinol-8 5-hydroxylase UbiM [Sedimenticola sp.]MCW8975841.1 5-demethoxyubiquinol-8 5-hydroxylase UbiM [Sedimenticola sp.]TVT56082.1 MAG: 5-demethoxyubiquinol-8 5-hydroxylase UbiM [Sedimenticola thiotaurini]
MKYDIVIIGGGPAGLSFARSLGDSRFNVLVVERSPLEQLQSPQIDGRDIALTHLSKKILTEMGVLSRIPADEISPIKQAKVINGNSSYCLEIDSKKTDADALGYLVPNYLIRKALYEAVEPLNNVKILTETTVRDVAIDQQQATVSLSSGEQVTATLVVAADSRFSESRRKMGISASMQDFGRVAIVSRMSHEKPHQQIAYECFHYGRTLAVLPLSGNLSSIVVTVSADVAQQIQGESDEAFAAEVQRRFKNRLGKMQLVGKRHAYPLVAVHANKFVKPRYALLGDASVGMHPVTAHGFNLGLRGQDTLYREIMAAHLQGDDIGSLSVLEKYQSKHQRVTWPLYTGTNEIVGLYTNDSVPAKVLRGLVLRLSNNFPPVKQMITRKLTELGGHEEAGLPFL